MRPKRATGDQAIARLAARQHGVVSVGQLIAAGIGRRTVSHRTHAGRLHRVHRGVYALGHAGLGNEGRWMAAVLAYGEDATLSHRSAAELWALLPHRHGAIDVTVPGTGGRRKRQGIRLHRSSLLTSAVTTIHDGIAVTTPAGTLADLGRCATPDEVRRAVRQAEVLGLPIGELGSAVDLTRSELERRFLRLCHRRRLSDARGERAGWVLHR